uniref:Sulfur compound chelating protein SoxZ n=1 Tax=Chlorobium chlorochromatii (strain CaD3) TaxID=340177 RepID=Q3APA3_CHLCH
MRVKATLQNNVVSVKMLLQHVMETGRRKDEAGALVPAHYITEVTATHKGETVFHAELGAGVSQNPYLSFQFTGASAGESLTISWVDSKGMSETADSVISAV